MTQNLFLTISTAYDKDEELYRDMFKLSATDIYAIMKEINNRKWIAEDSYVASHFIDLVAEGKVADNILMYMACYGAEQLYSGYRNGLNLQREMEDESK